MIKRATWAPGTHPITHTLSGEACDGAIRWLLRLRSGRASRRQQAAFMRWHAQNTEHAQALEEAVWIWRMLGSRSVLDTIVSEGASRKTEDKAR
ncbi:hypothetical protein C0Z18_07255 [Trinickia dabaoshanensis]|uniref:FecR N-terminal domain-containing protein n=1 Tax=Trinickia dabaoshanensis TaxID=564714 RepID=A0A2N7VWW0_9BURK|nr:FecR/PupR family sigma factor regulator [Trinickia dabaoshanensis]PMS21644.1 hypothetical protein C0Z18_07255 [Trinickia dabaoshanensis]